METAQHKPGILRDGEIIYKILNGEKALFEVLIRRYNGLLYKIARTYGLNHQDAEDMMQETHYTAYTQLSFFRHDASYKTWLTKIHLHKCYHKLHYGNLKYEVPADMLTSNKESVHPTNPANKMMNKELGQLLEQSLQQLPLPYRSVFVMREIEGFSIAETADLLQLTATNVKVRLNRAKTMLQKQLEQFYSSAELYEFNLIYCDAVVNNVFKRMEENENK